MILNDKLFLNHTPNIYLAADFETITTKTKAFFQPYKYLTENNTILYPINAYGFSHFDPTTGDIDKIIIGTSISDMFNQITNKWKNTTITCFFHNLYKFDGLVLIDWLRNNYTLIGKPDFNGLLENNQIDKNKNYYNMLIENKNTGILLIDVYLSQNNLKIRFQCSYRLLSVGIATLGKNLNFPKQTTNYHLEPQPSINLYPQQYIEYLKTDVLILAKSLINFYQTYYQTLVPWLIKQSNEQPPHPFQLTAASFSRKLISFIDEKNDFHKINFENNEIIKPYFRGGFTAFNYKYQDKPTKSKIKIFDAKSFYPTIMSLFTLPSNQIIVDGEFKHFEKIDLFINYLNQLQIHSFIKIKFNKVPIPTTNWATLYDEKPTQTNYTYNLNPNIQEHWAGTVRELKAALRFYKLQAPPTIIELVHFKKRHHKLKPLIDLLYKLKEDPNQNALTFKIILNAIYGSLAINDDNGALALLNQKETNNILNRLDHTNFLKTNQGLKNKKYLATYKFENFKTSWNPFGFKGFNSINVSEQKWNKKLKQYQEKKQNLWWNKAVSAYITSTARAIIFELISIDPDSVYYCDTDSLILEENSKIIDYFNTNNLIGKNLGQWEQEMQGGSIEKIHILAPKSYLIYNEKNELIKMGMKGVDKEAVYDLPGEIDAFFENDTIIPNGSKCRVIQLAPSNFDDKNYKLIPKKRYNQKYDYQDSYYPFIITKDKNLSKIASIRKELNNG